MSAAAIFVGACRLNFCVEIVFSYGDVSHKI